MNGCTNKDIGQMLHDYEIGLLSDDDRKRFEMHLYDCDHCVSQLGEFTDFSRILRHDPDARATINELGGDKKKSMSKRWTLYRLLIAAVIVMVVAVPIYRYGVRDKIEAISQTLELLPARAGGSDVIYLERGGHITIRFFVASDFQGSASVVIATIDADTVFAESNFSNFDENGMGSIALPISDFSEGHYMLTALPTGEGSDTDKVSYMFRVR